MTEPLATNCRKLIFNISITEFLKLQYISYQKAQAQRTPHRTSLSIIKADGNNPATTEVNLVDNKRPDEPITDVDVALYCADNSLPLPSEIIIPESVTLGDSVWYRVNNQSELSLVAAYTHPHYSCLEWTPEIKYIQIVRHLNSIVCHSEKDALKIISSLRDKLMKTYCQAGEFFNIEEDKK